MERVIEPLGKKLDVGSDDFVVVSTVPVFFST